MVPAIPAGGRIRVCGPSNLAVSGGAADRPRRTADTAADPARRACPAGPDCYAKGLCNGALHYLPVQPARGMQSHPPRQRCGSDLADSSGFRPIFRPGLSASYLALRARLASLSLREPGAAAMPTSRTCRASCPALFSPAATDGDRALSIRNLIRWPPAAATVRGRPPPHSAAPLGCLNRPGYSGGLVS